jgi:hypothetical protein
MKALKKTGLIFSLGITILFACDEIEEPFIEYNGQCGDASLPIPIKQILIEEFTGHKCGYCPEGDETIELLKDLYCDHVIVVSFHTGTFAETNSSGQYTYDYRTEEGNTISSYFSPSEYPSAIINRKEFGTSILQGQTNWASSVAELLEQKPVIDINIDASFDSNSRDLNIDIDVVFIEAMNEKLMLSVYFVEDSIVSWQKDYSQNPSDIEFYSHNHVFRDAINGPWGDEILNGQIGANGIKSKSFNYIINQEWLIKNSSLIAFVYKSNSKEILQASQVYLIP